MTTNNNQASPAQGDPSAKAQGAPTAKVFSTFAKTFETLHGQLLVTRDLDSEDEPPRVRVTARLTDIGEGVAVVEFQNTPEARAEAEQFFKEFDGERAAFFAIGLIKSAIEQLEDDLDD